MNFLSILFSYLKKTGFISHKQIGKIIALQKIYGNCDRIR